MLFALAGLRTVVDICDVSLGISLYHESDPSAARINVISTHESDDRVSLDVVGYHFFFWNYNICPPTTQTRYPTIRHRKTGHGRDVLDQFAMYWSSQKNLLSLRPTNSRTSLHKYIVNIRLTQNHNWSLCVSVCCWDRTAYLVDFAQRHCNTYYYLYESNVLEQFSGGVSSRTLDMNYRPC